MRACYELDELKPQILRHRYNIRLPLELKRNEFSEQTQDNSEIEWRDGNTCLKHFHTNMTLGELCKCSIFLSQISFVNLLTMEFGFMT